MATLQRFVLTILLLASSLAASAQTLSGTIAGQVTDQQGAALPGATVVLTGRTGSVEQVSDEAGNFRFLGLNPGEYSIRAELTGFRPFEQRSIALAIGATVQVRASLDVGGLTESVTVVAQAAAVDTTSTATDTDISQDLLFAMPFSRTNAAVNMLNNAPGVNAGSAYGGGAGSSNALLLDGVDTRDPEGGTAWTFFNYNIIDSIEIGGLGQPAEYGGFSGAVVNTITKSGGNAFSALQEFRYSNKDLRGDNVRDEVKRLNPTLLASGADTLKDYTVQLGGPIARDRAFFFGSIQRYAIEEDPAGPRTIRTEVSPRFNVKLTFQPTSSDTISVNGQYDQYNQTGRTGLAGVDATTDDLTIEQDSPEFIWNGSYRKVLGGSSFFEAKFTGYWGYFDLDPINQVSARNNDDGTWTGGAGYSAKYDRLRNQVNAAFNRYVEAGGTHNFKFGVEVERSTIRNRYAYTDGVYYYDIGNQPYLAYAYSYDVEGTNKRTTAYAQDQWTIGGRLTANVGVRFDGIGGDGSDGVEYYKTNMFSPRLGLAWDVTGRGNSVLKAFYGHLYDGAVFSIWNRAAPGIGDFVVYEALPGNRLIELDRVSGDSKYVVSDDIKHPRTDEFNVAYEQGLWGNWRATATYIRRTATNFTNSTLIGGQWNPVAFTNPKTNQPMTIYSWANRNSITQRFSIDNLDTVTYPGAGSVDAYRDYNAGMFVLSRRFANRWQAQLSYVYSKTTGTVTNASQAAFSSALFETPNTSLINRDGRVPNDRPHEFKLFAGYQVPVLEVALNASFRGTSGTTYTPFNRVASGRINWTSSADIQLEPQGSYRNDPIRILDLRVEKVFSIDVHRFGIYADIENAFNNGVVTTRNNRFPSVGIRGNTVLFGSPTAVTAARQITFGARWSF
jgi:Carboxypeptidase regulatory-like domain/TonB dependent receptor